MSNLPPSRARSPSIVTQLIPTHGGDEVANVVDALTDDYFYDDSIVQKTPRPDELPDGIVSLYHSMGFESSKRNNIHYIEDNVIVYSAGNTIHLLNLDTRHLTYIPGRDGHGIGALAVHPGRNHFAVAGKGNYPRIWIYEYPSLKLFRMLRRGTEKAFCDIAFSIDGTKLASVGGNPDYMLTVWDWKQEMTILRTKAFSQEVYRVTFDPYNDGQLTTCGTGHIRFWKMARTFTGLKLQGLIGKFGNVELTDISGYAYLPDGKVLAGTETGSLLLWDGNLIKAEVEMPGRKPCHDGMIEVVMNDGKDFLTAGMDGYIKRWDGEMIDTAEVTDESNKYMLEPIEAFKVEEEMQIKSLVRGNGNLLIQNALGSLLQFNLETRDLKLVLSFHAGAITGVDVSPLTHLAASTADDGSVRLFNFHDKEVHYIARFAAGGSCLIWAPQTIDPSGKTITVGFQDGVVRILKIVDDKALALSRVFKPHSGAVTGIAYSPNGRRIVTGSDDGTIFFLSVVHGYAPIGFVNLGSRILSVCWFEDCEIVLVATQAGELLQIQAPRLEDVDSSKTFEIEVQKTPYCFKRPPPPPPDEDDEAAEDGEKQDGEKKEDPNAGESPKKDENGKDPAGAPAAPAAAAATTAAEEEPPIVLEERPLGRPLCAICGAGDQFLLTCSGADSGYVYLCSTKEELPLRSIRTYGLETTVVRFSKSRRFLLVGGTDGSVEIRWIGAPDRFWRNVVHDGDHGTVTDACVSFDDQFLITAGADGSLFIYKVASFEFLTAAEVEGVPIKPPVYMSESEAVEVPEDVMVADITDSSHYSIQEAKLKTEHDKLVAAAELKKEGVRKYLGELREEFLRLVEANEKAHPKERLSREEMDLDPELRVMLEQEAAEKVRQARLELAWISEKKAVALRKLQAKFLDDIAVERIELLGFQNSHRVSSFRCPHLSQTLRDNMRMVHNLIRNEESSRLKLQQQQEQEKVQEQLQKEAERPASVQEDDLKEQGREADKQADGEAPLTNAVLTKAELRKQLRDKRAREWEELMADKPDDKYEDPEDVAAISWAEKNMGDYKLKTDDDYVVPESQRVNAEKKRRQMILLEESIHSIKMGFNERFLALRDLKKRICDNIIKDNQRIREINKILGIDEQLSEPSMVPCEFPENRDKFDREDLIKYEKKLERDKKKAEKAKQSAAGGGFTGGFGGFGGGKKDGEDEEEEEEEEEEEQDEARPKSKTPAGTPGLEDGQLEAAPADGGEGQAAEEAAGTSSAADNQLSDLELAEKQAYERKLQFEKECIQHKIEKTIATFDDALDELRREKFKLEADLKSTDMKMLVLYQELVLLKEFEKKDITLAKKLEDKRKEKQEIVAKISECQERLAVKKTEIESLLEKDKQIMTEFNAIVGENNKFYEPMLKIFKKKIKRVKKKVRKEIDGGDGGFASDDEDYDEDEDEELSSEEGEEGGNGQEDDDACPPGCDQHLYDKVCELRERRLDHEDILADFQKSIEALRKENEGLVKKEKVIDQGLHGVENDIQAFQTEKQRKLNELHVVIALKMHQIQCLVDNRLPDDLSQCLVFTNAGLTALRDRIKQLQQEKLNLRKQQKELRKEHVSLLKNKKAKESKIAELEGRAYDVQMLKFGQVIDLEVLERMSVNRTAEELKEKLRRQDAKNAAELDLWDAKVRQATEELARVTRLNTEYLQRVAQLSQQQAKLETALNASQNTMVAEFAPSNTKENEERQRLMELVKLQAREIDALKAEIQMLRRKGGHVYTPANRRQFSS